MLQKIYCVAFALILLVGPAASGFADVPTHQEERSQGFVAAFLDWLPVPGFFKSRSGVPVEPPPVASPDNGLVSQASPDDLPEEDNGSDRGPEIDPNG